MRRIKPPEHLDSCCSCQALTQGSLITSLKRTRVTTASAGKGLLEALETLGLGHAAPNEGRPPIVTYSYMSQLVVYDIAIYDIAI